MKQISTILFFLLITGMLQACNHAATADSNDNDTTIDTAVSAPAAQPDTAGPGIKLVIDQQDSLFAAKAAAGNLVETEMGNLAIKNGKSKRVRNFGLMMVKDHDKANAKLMTMAAVKKLTLPTTPNKAQQQMVAQLAKKRGGDFDRAYVNLMMGDHKQDVSDFTGATTKIQDPDIKAYAKKTLPVLQKHLDAINAIHDSMDNK